MPFVKQPGNNTMRTIFERKGWMILQGPNRSLATSWKAATCLRCGAKVFRKQHGDLDDWWAVDFENGLKDHEKDCPG
jgi:hypothetical protein